MEADKNKQLIIQFRKKFDKGIQNHVQEELQSDIIHRMLPTIQFGIRVFSKFVQIKTQNIFILPLFVWILQLFSLPQTRSQFQGL